ncbi:JmjC domain-containing protein [Streptomyces sp. NPDC017673]|uniref:JmjC domain-containing protein n=1 Tax=unclassified Streptomyces TaxID=2593676 RepID=UPI0037A248F2
MIPTALDDWTGSTAAFLARQWRTAPRVYRTSPVPPLTVRDVDAAIRDPLLRTPHLALVRDGAPVPETNYTTTRTVNGTVLTGFADAAAIFRGLREGCTLLLRNVEHWHTDVATLADRWQQALGRAVEGFLFITPPGAQGLAVHRDDADVLLLQIGGRKQWTVYPGPADGNWAPGAASDVGPPLLKDTLAEGDVLYIPRGYAHSAMGNRGLSVHLSMTIREASAQDSYAALQRLLLTGFTAQPRPLDDAALTAHIRRLTDRMRRSLDELEPHEVLTAARCARIPLHGTPPVDDLTSLAAYFRDHSPNSTRP